MRSYFSYPNVSRQRREISTTFKVGNALLSIGMYMFLRCREAPDDLVGANRQQGSAQ